jgi:hypothetical protein
MKPAAKRKWVKGLLKNIRQGQGALCQRDKEGKLAYCCLGVAKKEVLGQKPKRKGFVEMDEGGNVFELETFLTHEEIKDVGITEEIQEQLADLNDAGVPFPVIAGFINANL